jgi:hypothetical protein
MQNDFNILRGNGTEYFTPATRFLDQEQPELCRATWILANSFNQPERGLKIDHDVLHLVLPWSTGRRPL